MDNKDLKAKYDEMHKQGASAWYGDGREERETILKMGEPWEGLSVLEIGCGEGELCKMMADNGVKVFGVDYSFEAIKKAKSKYKNIKFIHSNYGDLPAKSLRFDRIVMQGVLEHMDDPFEELEWIISAFSYRRKEPFSIITSSPCFLNPRGIVWMTLDMIGAVMSKTDLHYLNPWEFSEFCNRMGYKLRFNSCDYSWAGFEDMLSDLKQRIPLSLKDGNLPFYPDKVDKFIEWLRAEQNYNYLSVTDEEAFYGATMVYRIDIL